MAPSVNTDRTPPLSDAPVTNPYSRAVTNAVTAAP